MECFHEAPRPRRHPLPLPRGGDAGRGQRMGRHLCLPRRVRPGAGRRRTPAVGPRGRGAGCAGRGHVGRGGRRGAAPVPGAARRGGDGPGALGLRVHDQRLLRQRLARDGATGRADHRGRRPGGRPRGLRRDEGGVRAGGAGARCIVDDRATGAHRRSGRPDRPLRLLAAAPGARRRGARARSPRRPRPGHRRTRSRDLAARPCESRTTGVYDAVGTPMPFEEMLAEIAAGVGSGPARAHVGRHRVPGGARASPRGPATAHSRCGCPAPSTTACWRTTPGPPSPQGCGSGR